MKLFLVVALALIGAAPAHAGQCSELIISTLGGRLQGTPANVEHFNGNGFTDFNTGVGVAYSYPQSPGYVIAAGVSYGTVPALRGAKVGDRVRVCRVSTPTDCPVGDNRGSVYSAFDYRTRRSWSLPDSEHMCGGA
jgi:hypothetical protein